MNDLVDTRTLATGLATLSSAIRTTAGEVGESYLKLDKSGHWKYGVDAIEPEEDSQWAVDPSRVAAGFIAWDSGMVSGEIMRTAPEAAAEGPLTRSDCPDVGVDWVPQMSLAMLCTGGPDEGVRVLYSASSISGLRAIRGVADAIAARMERGETDEIVPLVELSTDSYPHKRYGRIVTPVLTIVGWGSMSKGSVTEAPRRRRVV